MFMSSLINSNPQLPMNEAIEYPCCHTAMNVSQPVSLLCQSIINIHGGNIVVVYHKSARIVDDFTVPFMVASSTEMTRSNHKNV